MSCNKNYFFNVWMVAIIALFATYNSYAQDIIIKKNGEQIKAKIIEIGETEVKFKYFDAEDGPVISIKKDEIKTMQIQGKDKSHSNTINVKEDPMAVSNDAIKDKTSSLKFEFFSPLSQNLAFSYEWMIKPGFNMEAGVGIIGPGAGGGKKERILFTEDSIRPRGFFVKVGGKFLLGSTSDFVVEGIKYAHPLKGRYLKPEISYSNFRRTSNATELQIIGGNNTQKIDRNYQSFAINLIYGRQLILGNSITAGYYFGGGYGFDNIKSNNSLASTEPSWYFNLQRYAFHKFGNGGKTERPFTYLFGINLGIILKSPGWLTKTPPSNMDNKYDINRKNVQQIPEKIR